MCAADTQLSTYLLPKTLAMLAADIFLIALVMLPVIVASLMTWIAAHEGEDDLPPTDPKDRVRVEN